MTKNIFAILFLTLLGFTTLAQEMLTIPAYNPAVAKQFQVWKPVKSAVAAVKLPFYDDFSRLNVYPSPLLWADAFAFVNSDYAKSPPSIGVATLDALDDKGELYPDAGPNPFEADYLTSLPIRLDSIFTPDVKAIGPADSVYLSFYYQPQGRTLSPPSKKASLLLEFHSPGDNDTLITTTDTVVQWRWKEMWSTMGGITVDSFSMPDKQYFKQVIIPITDTLYFKDGFQFRFHNIATLGGNFQPDWRNNGSHWNIDVVYLTYDRSVQNDIFPDVAFGERAPTLLKNYEAMPYRQYRSKYLTEMKDTLDIAIANLDNKLRNIIYTYNVRKNSAEPFSFYNGGSGNIEPFLTNGYSTKPSFARPSVNFFYPISNEEKVVFHIIHTITPGSFPESNDSIQFDQMFSNYYAYDNGSAEAGVGINGSGSYAVEFKLNVSDTLRGLQIYFNPVIGGTNQKPVDLQVWNDVLGKPGQIIKTMGGVTPIYTDNLNELNTYWFEEPLVIDPVTFPGLIFYIGWTQLFNDNLNVGFDRYKDSHTKRFYNVLGEWEMSDSINYGSLMFRPVIGPANPLSVEKPSEIQHLSIQPNPVTDGNLIIRLPESWKNESGNNLEINIISATGSSVLSGIFTNPVNVSGLAPGFYLVLLTDKKSGIKASGKLIIR